MRVKFLSWGGCLLLLSCLTGPVWALGMEDFGNKPLNAANFTDWPGIMPVVNDTHRVYHTWVNGNEHCYYRGDTKALNAALKRFAATPEKVHEVILLPGPAEIRSFRKEKSVTYNWSLHLVGGIAKAMLEKTQENGFWSKYPVLTVYVGETIRLDQLKIPAGCKVLQLADLEKRYLQGLSSSDPTVQGMSLGSLAMLNPYSERNLKAIAKLLDESNSRIQIHTVRMLAEFGRLAKPVLPALQAALKTEDGQLRTQLEETIQAIEAAPDRAAEAQAHRKLVEQIQGFCAGLER
ncbi:MAG: HEAT repeat domain-containing protein [bacterium]|nr:HEAT repeat domain-containing protein [bacterium]